MFNLQIYEYFEHCQECSDLFRLNATDDQVQNAQTP